MASALRWLLGKNSEGNDVSPVRRGLPASWYRSPELYELERRAIFSRQWLLVTHRNRFTTPGDFVRFNEAGFSFFLCLDREGNIAGFHNICRHRGFPLVQTESGSAKIFACKYHGWSYGLNGKLAKAPYFQDVTGFQREENGLLPVHVHIDKLGFIWVNLECAENTSVPWSELLVGADSQERLSRFDFKHYKLDHCWNLEGSYNWKTCKLPFSICIRCVTLLVPSLTAK